MNRLPQAGYSIKPSNVKIEEIFDKHQNLMISKVEKHDDIKRQVLQNPEKYDSFDIIRPSSTYLKMLSNKIVDIDVQSKPINDSFDILNNTFCTYYITVSRRIKLLVKNS